tara:strand:- start:248 stop:406 length:159 start_codon:yes stop_codon:yes gene_type:complete
MVAASGEKSALLELGLKLNPGGIVGFKAKAKGTHKVIHWDSPLVLGLTLSPH